MGVQFMKIREQGWECPKCARIWAPRIGACGACNDRQTLSTAPTRPQMPYTSTFEDPKWANNIANPSPINWNFNGDDESFGYA